jgi:hypothetical protein
VLEPRGEGFAEARDSFVTAVLHGGRGAGGIARTAE